MLEELERIPNEGDSFVFKHLDIQIAKTDNRRVLEIIVTMVDDADKPLENIDANMGQAI